MVRTLSPLANARRRELNDRVERQAARMEQYYADMLEELEEQQSRAQQRGTDLEKHAARRQSIEREQRLRVAELRQKSALGVHLRLAALLVVRQPKLRIEARTVSERGPSQDLELVYDPLLESLEAVPCPGCHRPTYAFDSRPPAAPGLPRVRRTDDIRPLIGRQDVRLRWSPAFRRLIPPHRCRTTMES